jgi:uracil-DNA glycosylase family 4
MSGIEHCQSCSRLVDFLQQVKQEYPEYHCKPVPAVGDKQARLLVVGLAPGKHGANASGVPFTGDASGQMLFRYLQQYGFIMPQSNTAAYHKWEFPHCRITNAVKCLPPQNKPTADEILQCNGYLREDLGELQHGGVVLALGRVAHQAILKALSLKQSPYPFGHAAEHFLPSGICLMDSYHCSRYNIQTRRLTESMFGDIFERISTRLNNSS